METGYTMAIPEKPQELEQLVKVESGDSDGSRDRHAPRRQSVECRYSQLKCTFTPEGIVCFVKAVYTDSYVAKTVSYFIKEPIR
ncbi:MAG: hypothetical protein ABH810_00480 [bacterium]